MAKHTKQKRNKYRLLYQLEAWLETPMFLLALLWFWLFIIELTKGLTVIQQRLTLIIWILFILEFLLKLFLAPRKLQYVKQNWLTLIALVIPAFRVLRLLRAIRILRATHVVSSTKFVRALTSANRFLHELKEAQGPRPTPEMNVGIMIAYTLSADKAMLQAFVTQLINDTTEEIQAAIALQWIFHQTEPTTLDADYPRRPSDFLDEASLRMAEGPYA